MGRQIYLTMPPIPTEVRTATGTTVYTEADIQTGRKVWQTIGGQQVGSVWGHGSYVAPDWSADWLHRESVALLDLWAVRDTGRKYDDLDPPQQASLQARLQAEVRANTYDAATGVVTISEDRAAADRRGRRPLLPAVRQRPGAADAALAVRDPGKPDPGCRAPQRDERVLLLDGVVDGDQPPGRGHHLHQQLAVGAAGRQHADHADVHLDVRQHPVPARRRRRAGVVLRDDARQGGAAGRARQRSAARASADALDEGHGQVLLGGDRADRRADHPRRHHRALRGRRPGVLRLPARRVPALCRHAQLAPAARGAVDRDRVARHRPVHRAGDLGPRAEVPAPRRQLPVHLPAGHRGGRTRRAVGGRHAEDGPRDELLVRPPGLGIRRHGPLLAGVPVRRPDAVARASWAARCGRRSSAATTAARSPCCCSSPPSPSACSTAPA